RPRHVLCALRSTRPLAVCLPVGRSSTRFVFNAPPPTAIYTLSLHDALPICIRRHDENRDAPVFRGVRIGTAGQPDVVGGIRAGGDRKSTRLNSSHVKISYAVFCLKKKNKHNSSIPSPADFPQAWLQATSPNP